MTKEGLEKEATEFEENYTMYEVAKRKDGTDYTKRVCNVTVKEAYLAGAEPREKRIAELEQKLEQTEKKLFNNQFNLIIQQLKNWRRKDVELKEQNIKDCENFNKTMKEIKEQWNNEHYQLAKAKDIIKDYMIVAKGDHCTVCSVPEENRSINVLKLNEQAEQFLKEVSE